MTDDSNHDFSGLRIAMEHMLSHQNMALDQAAACMALYAMGLLIDHVGLEAGRALITTLENELEGGEN